MGAKKSLDKLLAQNLIKIKLLLNTEKLNIITTLVAMELESAEALEKTAWEV